MRTSKQFATITYNTESYLTNKLNEFVKNGIFEFWAYIEHLPEQDENKKHKHLFIIPSIRYECRNLIDALKEPDESNPTAKPLTCIIPMPSKFSDWYLYALHDKSYLASKGQYRKFHYTLDDFKVSDKEMFNELRHQINYSNVNRMERICAAVDNGETFESLVALGQIPIQLISQYKTAFDMLRNERTFRNGRNNHEEKE